MSWEKEKDEIIQVWSVFCDTVSTQKFQKVETNCGNCIEKYNSRLNVQSDLIKANVFT